MGDLGMELTGGGSRHGVGRWGREEMPLQGL